MFMPVIRPENFCHSLHSFATNSRIHTLLTLLQIIIGVLRLCEKRESFFIRSMSFGAKLILMLFVH